MRKYLEYEFYNIRTLSNCQIVNSRLVVCRDLQTKNKYVLYKKSIKLNLTENNGKHYVLCIVAFLKVIPQYCIAHP